MRNVRRRRAGRRRVLRHGRLLSCRGLAESPKGRSIVAQLAGGLQQVDEAVEPLFYLRGAPLPLALWSGYTVCTYEGFDCLFFRGR